MDREHHLLDRRFKFDRSDCFGDDLRRIRPNDVDAQDFAVLRVCNDFDEAVMRIDDRRLRVADEGELTNFHLEAFLFGLRLRQADAGDLRITISAAWNASAIHGLGIFPSDACRYDQASHAADVRALRQASADIFTRLAARRSPPHPLIGEDEAASRWRT